MITRRRFVLFSTLAVPAMGTMPNLLSAREPEIFSAEGLAIRGTDPVAYFTEEARVSGVPDYALMWAGTTWHFSSMQNMELFMANPEAYTPEYGGYCAFAMSRGYVASTDPEAWTIYEGKLYLNYSLDVRSRWAEDIPGNVEKADGHWPAALG